MSENPQFQSAQMVYAPREARFQPGNRRFQGIPSVERTPNGRLFACFYGGELEEQHGNYAVLAISDDAGRTWAEPYLVVVHPDESMRIFDPCLWIDPLGRLWFTWSQSLGYFDGIHGVWASICDAPDAPQPTFGPPRRIANGVMMCKPVVLSDGAWLFPCAVWSKWVRPEEAPEEQKTPYESCPPRRPDASPGENPPNRPAGTYRPRRQRSAPLRSRHAPARKQSADRP